MSTAPQPNNEQLPTRIVFRCFVGGVTGVDHPFKTERAARLFYEKMRARYTTHGYGPVTLRRIHETKHGYRWYPDPNHPDTYTVICTEP